MYNLTVANDHTYFVGVGGVLGHNAGCWNKLNDALNNMGMDNPYIDRNKIAHISVIYTDNLNLSEINSDVLPKIQKSSLKITQPFDILAS